MDKQGRILISKLTLALMVNKENPKSGRLRLWCLAWTCLTLRLLTVSKNLRAKFLQISLLEPKNVIAEMLNSKRENKAVKESKIFLFPKEFNI